MQGLPPRRPMRRGGLLMPLFVAMLFCPAALGFDPPRLFPDTSDTIRVFVDQLPGGLTEAQRQFAAGHYVGTQKQTSTLIDAIRVYNPDFLMIQYRLGDRDSGGSVDFIHNDTWSSDWATVNAHEDWFVHDDQSNRVYQLYGSIKEYCMDISGNINGNTTAGWKEFWVSAVSSDIAASHADGVFADSTHLPYAVPSSLWDSPMGSPPHTAYIPHLEAYYDYVYQQLDAANLYFIPNIGSLVTTLDTTTGYYEDVHGAMVEGFATKAYDTATWQMQADRTLNLLRNGKIWIAQNGVADPSDTAGRMWLLANFLLIKHDRSYLNILGADTQMHWWPEYDLALGAPLDPSVPDDITDLLDASGLYVRRYAGGLVLVNPTGTARSFNLGEADLYRLVAAYGGGEIGPGGEWLTPGGLEYTLQGDTVIVPAWSGAVLIVPEPATAALLAAGLAGAAALRRRRRAGRRRTGRPASF